MLKTPLNKTRTKSKSQWAESVIGKDATITDVYEYYKRTWSATNEKKDVTKPLEKIKKLVKIYLPYD